MRLRRIIGCLVLPLATGVLTTAAIALAGTVLYPQVEQREEVERTGQTLARMRTPFWSQTLLGIRIGSDTPLDEFDVLDRVRGATFVPAPLTDTLRIRIFGRSRIRDWSIYESGWPCRATWGWWCHDYSLGTHETSAGLVGVPLLNPDGNWPRTKLPYLPLYRGLILNTLFYAAIWWILLAIPRLIRRALRFRRGLCPRCAYDLRGTPNSPCPECGPQ